MKIYTLTLLRAKAELRYCRLLHTIAK